MPVVLYECETWSLILREEYRVRVFQKRVLRWECMDWIDVAEDRDQCRALVNSVMNLWVP
jgi:hypothetical protein